jgi:outer membrane protein assembly factor BamB
MRKREQARLRTTTRQERRYRMKQVASPKGSGGSLVRRLTLTAAMIFVLLLVGSMAVLFRLAHNGHMTISGEPKEEMMFVLVSETIYRLDMKTHQPLWHFPVPIGTGLGKLVHDTYYVTVLKGDQTKLYALDVASGKVRWQIDGPSSALANTVISDNILYFSTIKGGYLTVEALDNASGAKKWEHRLGDKLVLNGPFVDLVAASDKAVYGEMMTTKDGKNNWQRFALNAQDGSQLWQKDEEIANISGIDKGFLVNGVLCVAKQSNDINAQQGLPGRGYLVGYNAASGEQIWSKQLDGPLSMFGTTVLNGVIYLNTNRTGQNQGSSIYAFSVKDGTLIWHYQDTNTSGSSYPTVTEKGVYINRYAGQTLVAIDTASGKVRWTYNFQDNLTVEYPPAADNDQVYLSLPGNVIQILRASDGKQIGSFKVNGKVDPNNRVLLQVVE